MKHNLTYISLHLIWFHEIRIKYVKRKPPQTIIRKNAISPCLPRLHVVDIGWPVSDVKVTLTGERFFHYFTRDKDGFVQYRMQVILIIKYIQNWYTLQDIQIFDRASQSTNQFIDSYLLTIKKKSVIFSGSKQIPQRNTIIIIPGKYVNIHKNT